MESIPDHSIRVIILDESLSGCQLSNALLEQKLTHDGMLISLSPFVTERAFCTQYVVPAPVFLESLTELSTSFDSGSSSMSISCPLVPRPTNVLTPIEFTQQLAAVAGIANIESGSTEELLKKRITAIFSEKHGSIFNASTGQVTEVKNLLSADDLWNALNTGGCWMDSEESKKPFPAFRLTEFLPVIDIHKMQAWKDQRMLVPVVEKTVYNNSEISPLMSKVGQESGLRPFGCRVYLHPTTINGLDITDGCRVQVQTKKGSMKAEAHLDDTIMPGVVGISHTMDPQSLYALCEVNSDGSIYPTPVKIQKV
jgi:anaerobic selenocysteine-containing dehydrogenase